MMLGQKRGCKRHWEPKEYGQPLKPLNFYAKKGIKPYGPDQPKLEKQIYTSEQDFIEKQTQLFKQFRRPELVTGVNGRTKLRYKHPFRPVTSDSWRIYKQQIQNFKEIHSLSWFDESLPVDASAAGLNHPLLEEKPDTEDIPAAGLNNSLLDAQVPEITASPVGDLVAESLLVDKHDGGPKGQLVLEGSSFDPHAEDESLPYDPLNHLLLEEKADLEVLSSTPLPLDALDATEKAATVTEPVVEGLPCDPLDIPAAGFNNSLLDAQVPENTTSPVEDKHDVGPEGELVVEGSSFDPHGEDERLGKAAKKKAHQKMLDKKKRKSILLSPGRLSMKKMKMGRNLDGISQDYMVVAMFKSVIEEMSSMKKEVKTLKKEFKSYINK